MSIINDSILQDIKTYVLYDDKAVTEELPNGDLLRADCLSRTVDGKNLYLILTLTDRNGDGKDSMYLEWFPEDDILLEAIQWMRDVSNNSTVNY